MNIIKSRLQNIDPVAVTALSFALIGPFAGAYLFGVSDFVIHFQEPNGLQNFGYIAILAVVGTAIAVLVFNMLIPYIIKLSYKHQTSIENTSGEVVLDRFFL